MKFDIGRSGYAVDVAEARIAEEDRAAQIAADIKALAVRGAREQFGAPEQISDPREMRIRLLEVSRRGDRIDGKRFGPHEISGPASTMARQILIAGEVQGFSGEDLMTVLAFNALLQVERDFDRQLEFAMITPSPRVIMDPAGLAHSPAIGEFALKESVKLRERIKALEGALREADSALCTAHDYFHDRMDTKDGDEGDPPGPNEEMSLTRHMDEAIEAIRRALA